MATQNAPQEGGIWISQEEFKILDQMVGNLPTKEGIYFVDFFRQIQQKRQIEAKQAESSAQPGKDLGPAASDNTDAILEPFED